MTLSSVLVPLPDRGDSQLRILFCAMFVVMTGFGLIIPTLSFLAKDMGASPVGMSLLVASWAFVQFLTAPLWGLLADRVGRKPVLVIGLAGNGLTFIMFALAYKYELLLAARALGGLLSAATFPTVQALAADLSPASRRGNAMNLIAAAFGAGFLFGPALGGWLAAIGLRVPFWVGAVASFVTVLFVLMAVREPTNRDQSSRSRLNWRALQDASFGEHAVLYWLTFVATFAASSLFSLLGYFMIDRLLSTESQVGIAFTALGVGSLLAPLGSAQMLSRLWGEGWILWSGLTLSTIGFLALTVLPSFAFVVGAIGVTGVGIAMTRPALASLISQRTLLGYGSAMGLMTGFDALGRTAGPLWAGMLYGWGPVVPFLSAGGICGLSAVYALRIANGSRASADHNEGSKGEL